VLLSFAALLSCGSAELAEAKRRLDL
jgi:hypothetical protein